MTNSTLAERFNEKFHTSDEMGRVIDFEVFLKQEISLALQKRNEELVGKVNALDSEYGSYQEEEYSTVHQLLSKKDILNIIQQP